MLRELVLSSDCYLLRHQKCSFSFAGEMFASRSLRSCRSCTQRNTALAFEEAVATQTLRKVVDQIREDRAWAEVVMREILVLLPCGFRDLPSAVSRLGRDSCWLPGHHGWLLCQCPRSLCILASATGFGRICRGAHFIFRISSAYFSIFPLPYFSHFPRIFFQISLAYFFKFPPHIFS